MNTFTKVALALILVVLSVAGFIWLQIPSAKDIKGCIQTTMFGIDLCPQNKNYVILKNISSHLQKTIIMTEDSSFYTHNGFDSEGIERCIEKMKAEKRIVCGGSTISQQLAKNLFLTKNKSFIRKGLEALITMKLEKLLTKREILEKYLNVAQFGKDIFGVKSAAAFYFKKSAAELDPVESAFLAMVLPNPEKYSQSYFRKDLTKFARRRLSQIITNLYKYKSLTEEQYLMSQAKLDSFLQSGLSEKSVDSTLTDKDVLDMTEEISIDDIEIVNPE